MPISRKTSPSIQLETAVVVVQAAAAHAADHPVENPAGINLVPGIVARLLPAADHIVSLFELGEKAGNLGRVVLEIAVERENQFAPARLEPRREGRRLAKVAAKPDRPHPRIALGQRGQNGPRTVATAVIDENEFDRPADAFGEHGIELAVKRGQARFLIMDRNDDADHGQSGPVVRDRCAIGRGMSKPGKEDRGGRPLRPPPRPAATPATR